MLKKSSMDKKLERIRHSLAHLLAYSVKLLFPETKLGIGPPIENGFYYDFDFQVRVGEEDLAKIEEKMRELIRKNIPFKKKFISKSDAKTIFKDEPYKLELIEEIKQEKVSIYESGEFVDLCRGPHVRSTKEIDPLGFKLYKIAGAYWRGRETNPMLTRIYGLGFERKEELDEFLKKKEELEKRDHRILSQKLELFMFDEEVGQGLPIYLPKGAILRRVIENFIYEELKREGEYVWAVTPHIGNLNLWKKSGHWDLYRENMYQPIKIESEEYLLKPMNCPFHAKIFASKMRSYKDLPIRIGEFGCVYRFEKSGTLHGLTRVRGFTQDDGHIFCTKDQLGGEIERMLKTGLRILKKFGFSDIEVYLSTRPEKFAGEEKDWKWATGVLKYVLGKFKIDYSIDVGGGAFYGPKIDVKIKDALSRPWQCTTIQIDFNLPRRFNLFFINKKGRKEIPFLVHRAFLGSIERFMGVLIEHYQGAFPFWISPEQIWIITVASRHKKYGMEVEKILKEKNIRVVLKDEKETVSKKIRNAEIMKIPYVIVVGDKEKRRKRIRVRKRGEGDLGEMSIKKFLELLRKETPSILLH